MGNDAANSNIEEVSENEYDSTSDDEPLACIASRLVKNANETPINKNNTTPTTYKWRSKNFEPLDETFKEPEMTPTPDVEKTPFQYFKLFVSDEMLNNTTEQTNIYILQSKGAEKSILRNDIEKFIGVFLRMGLVRLPIQRPYWETFMTYDGVSSVMGRNKFETILRNIHFVNNLEIAEEEKANDRIWKLRTWITELCQNFLRVSPEEFHAVDEIMVPFKGKSLLRQYLPKKPHKWGFKLWGQSGISGFLYDFDIYQGKLKSISDTSLGISADVVVNLTSSLPDKHNFKVFADNYFTNLPLIVELRKRNIYFVGMIRGSQMKKCLLLSKKDLKKQGEDPLIFKSI